jgi:hypothetical protein
MDPLLIVVIAILLIMTLGLIMAWPSIRRYLRMKKM